MTQASPWKLVFLIFHHCSYYIQLVSYSEFLQIFLKSSHSEIRQSYYHLQSSRLWLYIFCALFCRKRKRFSWYFRQDLARSYIFLALLVRISPRFLPRASKIRKILGKSFKIFCPRYLTEIFWSLTKVREKLRKLTKKQAECKFWVSIVWSYNNEGGFQYSRLNIDPKKS